MTDSPAYDVIIIGAGIAGLVTANRAAQLGKHVAVLEKSTDEKYICNSRYAYGTFHINFTGLDARRGEPVTASLGETTAPTSRCSGSKQTSANARAESCAAPARGCSSLCPGVSQSRSNRSTA